MIRFNNVTKDFGGETPALDTVTFDIQDGEFVFLTGHSGSGKSTLLKIITKEYIPTSGDVEFDHVFLSKIRGSKVHKHRRQIGVVFQDYRLLPELNIWENIALPLEIIGKKNSEIEERVTDLLELVQLTEKAHVFPSQLSGGESQRVGVARALATAPSVLLADEPTGNLDPQNTMLIAKLFHKINELGTTIIFATHDPAILNTLPHRRINLTKGRISEDTAATGNKPRLTTSEPDVKTEKIIRKPEKSSPPPIHTENILPPVLDGKDEISAKVENLDGTPVKEEAPAKKRSFPRISLSNPFGKKNAVKQADEEVHVEVESLEDKPEDKK
ncbi:hypothetical protein BH10PAT2_BH10PAT2_1340 [soil metagenome]